MRRILAVVLLVVASVGFAVPALAGEMEAPRVYGPHAVVRGADQRTWATRWLKAMLGEPTVSNPLLDPALCGLPGPNGSEFLTSSLGGTTSTHCRIKQGTLLVLIPGGYFYVEDPSGEPAEALRDAVTQALKAGVVAQPRLRIDGRYFKVWDHRFLGPLFRVNFGSDNLAGYPPGSYKTFAGGWVVLVTLPVGQHTVVSSDVANGGLAEIRFHITVVR